MCTTTIFNQTDHTGTACYDSVSPDDYLSNSSSYSDNESDLGSDDYNNYKSNYESDNEETSCTPTSTTETPLVQLPNTVYKSEMLM